MRKRRLSLAPMVLTVAAMAATVASAAGFGSAFGGAVLGRPLDFVVPLRLDPADTLAPDCVGAEVTVGDRRLPASQVRAHIERQGAGAARVRVATVQAVDEPVVDIRLAVGCTNRLSRRFVVLADPPRRPMPDAGVAVADAPVQARPPAAADAAPVLAAAAPPIGRVTPKSVALRTGAAAAAGPAPRMATQAPVRPAARPLRRADRRQAVAQPRPAATANRSAPARLRLETALPAAAVAAAVVNAAAVDAGAVDAALLAVADAASATRASAAAASAASARIASLEGNVARLEAQARADRGALVLAREQLAHAGAAGGWVLPLLALVALLTALAAWLAWRLSGLQRETRLGWQGAAAPVAAAAFGGAPTAAAARQLHEAPISLVGVDRSAPDTMPKAPAGWAEAPPDTGPMRTEALGLGPAAAPAPSRDVSIEELIDLEQQADFFTVLGQDEAALDLLMQHLRDTGGGSPLPYLKLLEIHRRRGDREAYERMRVRFNHRFNAYAPGWGIDPQAGRSLEDYPGVLPRLQQVWPRPLDAMAELEALLFRKSRGDLFDLPAYREVLFLYALARDRLDRDPVDTQSVDLLLPLADGGEFSTTAPAPLHGSHDADGVMDADGLPAAVAVDLDLDLTPARHVGSIFDPVAATPAGRRP